MFINLTPTFSEPLIVQRRISAVSAPPQIIAQEPTSHSSQVSKPPLSISLLHPHDSRDLNKLYATLADCVYLNEAFNGGGIGFRAL